MAFRTVRFGMLLLLALSCGSAAGEPLGFTIALEVAGEQIEGTPLVATREWVRLLGRDGRLHEFAPAEAQNYRRTSNTFQGVSAGEMRAALSRQFGRGYEVSGTGHFLVVHPAGLRDRWAPRFEELYRSFVHYFSVRGVPLREPPYPLVSVVFSTRAEFDRFSAGEGHTLPREVVGFYSPRTNWIALYDRTSESTGRPDDLTLPTLIHEATHQSAFNTGLHQRFAHTPQWVVEGLGTLFEARGVWDSRRHPTRVQRVNRDRLAQFRAGLASRPRGRMGEMLASDRLFRESPLTAYAEAWALAFYLSETQPSVYGRYLRATSTVEPFTAPSTEERVRVFTSHFGENLPGLEQRMLRFLAELP